MVFTASFAPLARSSPALFLRSAAAQTAGATRSFSSSGSATTVPDSGTTAPAALSPEEALYLAKEAGFYTKQELQEQIIRSPPFSKSRSPFLLEDFLAPLPVEDKIDLSPDAASATDHEVSSLAHDPTPRPVHAALRALSDTQTPTFTDPRTGREWLIRAEGRGTHARAAAHVVLRRGSGVIKINGEEDFFSRWPHLYNRMDVCSAFLETKAAGLFDVFVAVKGGGPSGQAMASRLAIARALAEARPACVPELEARQLLFEDLRQKLPYIAGKVKSRKSYRWNKR